MGDRINAWVVNDVIENVRRDFEAAGYTEETLNVLKENWMENLRIKNQEAAAAAQQSASIAQQYAGSGGYGGAVSWDGSGGGFPAIPMAGGASAMAPLPQSSITADFGKPTQQLVKVEHGGEAAQPYLNTADPAASLTAMGQFAQQNYQQAYDQPGIEPLGLLDDAEPSAKRARTDIPQSDGAWEASHDGKEIPQVDGDIEPIDINFIGGGEVDQAPQTGSITAEGRDLEDENLGSEDDDDDGEPDTDDVVLCQFEKVDRVKTKYKCKFKYGIVEINGKEHAFSECKADFEF